MRVEVFDVAAERGGALTVLREFYEAAVQSTEHDWVFHVSEPQLTPTKNVRVFSHPWVKRSWFHRLYFEAVAGRLVRQNESDMVVSLQNLAVWGTNVRQAVYVHQSLPYSRDRYKVSREPRLWAYQNVISKLINRSVMKASLVIVQSQWMKDMILERLHVEPEKIHVFPPEPLTAPDPRVYEPTPEVRHRFFYPSSFQPYKNHRLIIDACRMIHEACDREFRVELTVSPEALERLLVDRIDSVFTSGPLTFEDVQIRYAHAVLLYPSKLESYALPIAEAKRAGAIILAADTPFGREVLNGYPNARLFPEDDPVALMRLMLDVMSGAMNYVRLTDRDGVANEVRPRAVEAILNIGIRTPTTERYMQK